MKLYTCALFFLAAKAVEGDQNQLGCIDEADFDPSIDYFPEKVNATESKFWDIQYFNSYKILRNEIAGETFVLYQCGAPISDDIDPSNYTHVLPVPLPDGVALESTTEIPRFEMLGLNSQIKAWFGYPDYITSPCLNASIYKGDVEVILDPSDQGAIDDFAASVGADFVSFHSARDAYSSKLKNVTLSSFAEASNEAVFEWTKFIAAFFNLEGKANELFDESSARYACVTEKASLKVAADTQKPTVVWAAYTNYSGADGWSVAECPNYYCEYAQRCSADILTSSDGTIEYFGSFLLTTEAFIELAKDATHWIYPSPNWDEANATYGEQLANFVSVKNKQVFDTEGNGPNTWFEQRLAEYDVVLQDFCEVVGTYDDIHQRVWLRNVFTEKAGLNEGQCMDTASPMASRASTCISATASGGGASGADRSLISLIAIMTTIVASFWL